MKKVCLVVVFALILVGMVDQVKGAPLAAPTTTETDTSTGTGVTTSTNTEVDGSPAPTTSSIMSAPSRNSAGASKSMAKTTADATLSNFTYVSDAETRMISGAVEMWNMDHQEPIMELSPSILEKLVSGGYLREYPKNPSDLVLRNGTVMRKVVKTQEVDGRSAAELGDSFRGSLESGVTLLGPNSPKSVGNAAPSNALRFEKQTINVKVDGVYKEVTMMVPVVPVPEKPKDTKPAYIAPRPSFLQRLKVLTTIKQIRDKYPVKPTVPTANRVGTTTSQLSNQLTSQ